MFVVCSGGQWWYRYWVNNNGYLTDLGSAMPGRGAPVGSLARDGAANRGRGVAPPRSARVAYHPATDAVVLHNIWKPPYPGMLIKLPTFIDSFTSVESLHSSKLK